jgi:hypothetical protein
VEILHSFFPAGQAQRVTVSSGVELTAALVNVLSSVVVVQIAPVGQTVPHAPQLFGSVCSFTQTLPHVCPVMHAQLPVWQVSPLAH